MRGCEGMMNGTMFMGGLGILWLALVALVAVMIWWFIVRSSRPSYSFRVHEELQLRFVRGEITEEELEKMENVLFKRRK